MFVAMSEPAQKCENNTNTQKLFSSFKILYSCCFGFSISFITSTTDGKIKGCPKYPKVTHKSCIFTSKVIFFNITQNVGLLFIRKLVTNTFLKNRPIWSHCSLHTINYHLFVFVAYQCETNGNGAFGASKSRISQNRGVLLTFCNNNNNKPL